MKRKWTITEIEDVSFETNSVTHDEVMSPRERARYDNILCAYRNPSYRKQKIWEWWYQFAARNGYNIRIASRNSQIFTIVMWNDREMLYITPCHNYRYVYIV